MDNIISKLAIFALKSKRLSGDQRTALMTAVLVNISAIPIEEIVKFDPEGTMIIRGRKMDLESAKLFRESAISLYDNFARKLIAEQTAFEAIKMGIHNGLNPEMIQFSKAILWWNEQQNKLISRIAGE